MILFLSIMHLRMHEEVCILYTLHMRTMPMQHVRCKCMYSKYKVQQLAKLQETDRIILPLTTASSRSPKHILRSPHSDVGCTAVGRTVPSWPQQGTTTDNHWDVKTRLSCSSVQHLVRNVQINAAGKEITNSSFDPLLGSSKCNPQGPDARAGAHPKLVTGWEIAQPQELFFRHKTEKNERN